jgi:alkylhydroperoxidase family enzyme
MRATLGLLEKITLTPAAVGPADMEPLRRAGVSDQAIEDALVICALFNIIDRLADTFDVDVPSAEDFVSTGERLLITGYF